MSKFGELKAKIEREGQPLPDADVLIAATALEIGGNLVTGNVRHFKRFDGLTIANWIR